MSLKTIHVVFVIASLLMTLFFGVWSWRNYFGPEGTAAHLAYGLLSVGAAVGLVVYGKYFSQETPAYQLFMMRPKMHYFVALVVLLIGSAPVQACTVCFGESDSRMAQGMNLGIAVLLAVITTVLCGVAGFFYYMAKRNENMEAEQHLVQQPQN